MKVVMTNSFRGGTGKSTIISNLASYLASFGFKTLIIDTDIVSPGVHAIFGLSGKDFDKTVTDYIKKDASVTDIIYDVSENLNIPEGSLFIAPASMDPGQIAEVLRSSLTGEKILRALPQISKKINPDFVLIDTHPGLNEEALVALESVDQMLSVVRPDNQDYQGLEVMSDITKRLDLDTFVVMNKVPKKLFNKKFSKKVEAKFSLEVAGVLPFSEDLLNSQSAFVFSDKFPGHQFSQAMQQLASKVFGVQPREHLDLMQYLLRNILEKGPVSELALIAKNVYQPKARLYLQEMLGKEFITNSREKYTITQKGESFLRKFGTFKRFVRDFRL